MIRGAIHRLLFFLGLIFFGLALGNAQASEGLWTLQRVLSVAKEKNPSVIMAQERTRQALERLRQARSPLLPRAQAEMSWQTQTKNLETLGIPTALPAATESVSPVVGPIDVFDARLQVTQSLLDWAMFKRLEASGIGAAMSRIEQEKVKDDVLLFVTHLYAQALRARQTSELSRVWFALCQEKFRWARIHFQNGSMNTLEYRKARAELLEGRSLWRAGRDRTRSRLEDLRTALMIQETEALTLEDPWPGIGSAPLEDDGAQGRVGNSSDIRLLEQTVLLRKAERAAEEAGYFPRVAASGDVGLNGNSPRETETTYSYGIKFSWPFFESGYRQARVAEADSRARESQIHLEDAKRQKQASVFEAKRILDHTRFLKRAKAQLWRQFQDQTLAMRLGIKNGGVSADELLEAQWQEALRKNEYQEASAAALEAWARWTYLIGDIQKI